MAPKYHMITTPKTGRAEMSEDISRKFHIEVNITRTDGGNTSKYQDKCSTTRLGVRHVHA